MNAAVDQGTVSALIDGLRQQAEAAAASVKATLAGTDGAKAVARVVAGFYNLLDDLGGRVMRAHQALALAMGRNPTPETRAQFVRSIQLLTYWSALANGFGTYVRPATDAERTKGPEIGAVPIAAAVIVVAVAGAVAVIAVSLTGAAWAVVHYEQAANLRKEIELLEANPATADALAKINEGGGAGPGGPDKGPGMGTMVAVGLGVLGAVGLGVYVANKAKG